MFLSFSLFPQAYAACSIGGGGGGGGINLSDCFLLDGTKTVASVYNSPATLVNVIVPNLFIGGGFALLGIVLLAAWKMIRGGTKGWEEARKLLTTALLGFLLMFSAFWIVQIIRIVTGAAIDL